MEDINEILRSKVVRSFNEYKDYVELVNESNKTKKEKLSNIKELYETNQDDEEVVDFSFEIFIVDNLHQRDIQILGTKFVHYCKLYKEIPDIPKLDEEIETTFDYFRDKADEQSFIVNKGKFEEITKGFISEKKKIFEDKDLYKKLQSELEKYL